MKFDWHGQYFDKVLHGIGKSALAFINQGYDPDGWYSYFEENFPDAFARYKAVYKDLNDLWGKTDSESMEKFKALCKTYQDAYRYALNKFMEHLKAEKMKGTQASLL